MTKEQQEGNKKISDFMGLTPNFLYDFHNSWESFMCVYKKLHALTFKNLTHTQRSSLKSIQQFIILTDIDAAFKYAVEMIGSLKSA